MLVEHCLLLKLLLLLVFYEPFPSIHIRVKCHKNRLLIAVPIR